MRRKERRIELSMIRRVIILLRKSAKIVKTWLIDLLVVLLTSHREIETCSFVHFIFLKFLWIRLSLLFDFLICSSTTHPYLFRILLIKDERIKIECPLWRCFTCFFAEKPNEEQDGCIREAKWSEECIKSSERSQEASCYLINRGNLPLGVRKEHSRVRSYSRRMLALEVRWSNVVGSHLLSQRALAFSHFQ